MSGRSTSTAGPALLPPNLPHDDPLRPLLWPRPAVRQSLDRTELRWPSPANAPTAWNSAPTAAGSRSSASTTVAAKPLLDTVSREEPPAPA
jgi:hypothetical protein